MGQGWRWSVCALAALVLGAATVRAADEEPPASVAVTDAAEAEEAVPRGWNTWLSGESQYVPRAGIGYDLGRGLGYPDSYGHVAGMIPWAERSGELLIFSDLRMLLDNDGHPGSNLGLGYRYYAAEVDRTFGTVFYYDLRETDLKTFQQLTVSFDTLGVDWDLRTNVYVQSIFSDTAAVPTRFSGNSLWLPGEDRALSGFDLEVMAPLPMWRSLDPRVGVGCYHLLGSEDNLWGWKLRAETRIGEGLSADLTLNRDDQFGTTLNLGVAMWLPNTWAQRPGTSTGRRTPSQRLGEPVKRQENIAVLSQPTEVARDRQTGLPLQFLHVASATNSGNGSYESPFNSLGAAIQDPRYQAGTIPIVYVRNSPDAPLVYADNLTMVAGTQLRSNGPVQYLPTQRGWVRLPGSGADPTLTTLPRIEGIVTLANNTYFSGFEVDWGIVGTDVSNVTIAENRLPPLSALFFIRTAVSDSGDSTDELVQQPTSTVEPILPALKSILLTRAAGTVVIRDNVMIDPYGEFTPAHGVCLRDTQGAHVTIAGNTVQNCETGIALVGGRMTADIRGNTITGSGRESFIGFPGDEITGFNDDAIGRVGFFVDLYGQAIGLSSDLRFTGNISGNTLSGGHDGIVINGGQFSGTISQNSIHENTGTGITLRAPDFSGTIGQNIIRDNNENGIQAGIGAGGFQGVLVGNVIQNNASTGITFGFDGSGGNHYLSLRNNQFSGNGTLFTPEPGTYDLSVSQKSTAGCLYLELDGNVCQDLATPGGNHANYTLSHITSMYGHSYPGEFYLHLGENVGTVGNSTLGALPATWSDWPQLPE